MVGWGEESGATHQRGNQSGGTPIRSVQEGQLEVPRFATFGLCFLLNKSTTAAGIWNPLIPVPFCFRLWFRGETSAASNPRATLEQRRQALWRRFFQRGKLQ